VTQWGFRLRSAAQPGWLSSIAWMGVVMAVVPGTIHMILEIAPIV